ncbi:MAG: uracil-DNA glycosylase [Desulfobacterales bacterium]
MDSPLVEIIDEARQYLKFIKALGGTNIGAGKKGREITENWKPAAEGCQGLLSLQAAVRKCRRCRLADERKSAVFGQGSPEARLMFVGSFPEAHDEDTGIPYSGEAGALLTRIIEAIGESRESVYICHAVKCRPSSDRLPDRFEAGACRTWLREQIREVRPGIICLLGGFAAQTLLKTDEPFSRLRGRFYEYEGIPVMPTHEPAYLLVHTNAKRAVWEDMKKVMARMNG